MLQLSDRYIPVRICLTILQYCDVPEYQRKRAIIDRSCMVNAKAYSSRRLVSRWWYMCETLSRCNMCTGRYIYHTKYVKCNVCCHIYNRKEVQYKPEEFMWNEKKKKIHKLLDCHIF